MKAKKKEIKTITFNDLNITMKTNLMLSVLRSRLLDKQE